MTLISPEGKSSEIMTRKKKEIEGIEKRGDINMHSNLVNYMIPDFTKKYVTLWVFSFVL